MTPALRIERLVVAYGDRVVLHGVDLSLERGAFLALVGPNGSGKTTLLRAIAGLVVPREGRVVVDGVDLAADPRGARARLGLSVDPVLLPGGLTGRECLALFAGARGHPAIPDETLALAEALAFSAWLDWPVGATSAGTRQKLGVLLGLLGTPPLLVLDEPLNGLDVAAAWALKRHLAGVAAEGRAAVVLATHGLELAGRFVDHAVLLDEGRVLHRFFPADLAAIRADPGRSLEQAVVERLARRAGPDRA